MPIAPSACCPLSLPSQAVLPVRSARTSLILAERARQRRWKRRQRRQARAHRAAWLALLDRRPFDSICTHPIPGVIFVEAVALIYALPLS
jgi:hypothetical protein